jgi:hypothetical protein
MACKGSVFAGDGVKDFSGRRVRKRDKKRLMLRKLRVYMAEKANPKVGLR